MALSKPQRAHLVWLSQVESGQTPKLAIKVNFRTFNALAELGLVEIITTGAAYEVARLTDKGRAELKPDRERYETRTVLAQAYRKGREEETFLTHLLDKQDKVKVPVGSEGVAMCRQAKNLADSYALSEEGRKAKPTCERCAVIYTNLGLGDAK